MMEVRLPAIASPARTLADKVLACRIRDFDGQGAIGGDWVRTDAVGCVSSICTFVILFDEEGTL
jgi:hypothetical protein